MKKLSFLFLFLISCTSSDRGYLENLSVVQRENIESQYRAECLASRSESLKTIKAETNQAMADMDLGYKVTSSLTRKEGEDSSEYKEEITLVSRAIVSGRITLTFLVSIIKNELDEHERYGAVQMTAFTAKNETQYALIYTQSDNEALAEAFVTGFCGSTDNVLQGDTDSVFSYTYNKSEDMQDGDRLTVSRSFIANLTLPMIYERLYYNRSASIREEGDTESEELSDTYEISAATIDVPTIPGDISTYVVTGISTRALSEIQDLVESPVAPTFSLVVPNTN